MQEDIKKALDVLRSGGVILYPTDTDWTLGCDATNENAVKRICEIRKCVDKKSMIILVDTSAKIQGYMDEVPDMAWDLIEFAEKPLTIIYPGVKNIATNLVGDDKTIGIRVTKDAFSKRLCEQFRKPIVSTSANISGTRTPDNFKQISDEIKTSVDYVVNFRQEDPSVAKASSIIKLGKGNLFQMIRA